MPDPLTLFTQTFESYLINSPAIKQVMKSNVENRIDAFVTSQGGKFPDVVKDGFYPFIVINPLGGPCGAIASNLVQFEMSYEVGIQSKTSVLSFDLYPLTFAIFAACSQALHDSTFDDLSWQGYNFVNKVEISNLAPSLAGSSDDAKRPNTSRAVCAITATLHFPESMLEDFNAQT